MNKKKARQSFYEIAYKRNDCVYEANINNILCVANWIHCKSNTRGSEWWYWWWVDAFVDVYAKGF